MRRWAGVGVLLGQRRRRWANNEPALGRGFLFAGGLHCTGDARQRTGVVLVLGQRPGSLSRHYVFSGRFAAILGH